MDALINFGHELIITIQAWRTPFLDVLFQSITWLGSEDFMLLLLLVLWWAVDKRLAMRLLPLAIVAIWLGLWIKEILDQPRPFDPRVAILTTEESFGFPSVHSLIGVVIWGFLSFYLRRRWMLWAAGVLAFAIGLSRIYLGIHFPHDVVGGWLLGLLLLISYAALLPRLAAAWAHYSLPMQIGLGVALSTAMLLLFNQDPDARALTGFATGVAIAAPIEQHRVRFVAWIGLLWQKIARLVLGIVVVFALRIGLKALLPDAVLADVLRYALLAIWVTGAAPWIFVMLRLTPHSRQRTATAQTS